MLIPPMLRVTSGVSYVKYVYIFTNATEIALSLFYYKYHILAIVFIAFKKIAQKIAVDF